MQKMGAKTQNGGLQLLVLFRRAGGVHMVQVAETAAREGLCSQITQVMERIGVL
jgi:hypothetical protein